MLENLSGAAADAIPIDEQLSRDLEDDSSDADPRYTVTLRRTTNPAVENVALQLLTTMSTLVVAVAAFYFGSASVETAHARERDDRAAAQGNLREEQDETVIATPGATTGAKPDQSAVPTKPPDNPPG